MNADVFERMVAAVGVGIGVYDADGRYRYVNEAYAEMLEADRESLLGTAIWEVNPDLEGDQFDVYWESFGEGETRIEEAKHRFDGTTVPVETLTTRIDVDGEIYHVGTIQEITERKTDERRLEELHSVTRKLIDAGDREEICRITARAARDILGYESNVVRLVTDTGRLRPAAVTERAESEMGARPAYPLDDDNPPARAYERGEPLRFEDVSDYDDDYDRGETRSAMYLPIGGHGVLSVTDPEPDAFDRGDVELASVLASNAETALDRLEKERELQRKNERLEVFVDVIAHDIPNQLNAAGGWLDQVRERGDLDDLVYVSRAHDRIEELIVDMRALIEQDVRVEDMEWVRLSDALEGCWDRCCLDEEEPTLEIVSDGHLRANRSRLEQLLENLFWNACDHAGEDPSVRAGLLEDGFFVEDDGPGIPEDEREDVLSPGYTHSNDENHSGFGLAIVREIVRAHDWEIEVLEGIDGGARFEITGVTVEQ